MALFWMFFTVYLIYTIPTGSGLECHCEGNGCAEHLSNITCIALEKAKCFASVGEIPDENGQMEIVYSAGCLPEDEQSILQCKANLVPQVKRRFHILCCDDEDLCNQHLEPQMPTPMTTTTTMGLPVSPSSSGIDWNIVAPVIGVGIFILLCGLCVLLYYRCIKPRGKMTTLAENRALLFPWKSSLRADNDLEKGIDHSMTSGSGSGCPRLVQSTVARQLQLLEIVGKGRYGEVWRARFRDEDVAVKIFCSIEMDSWQSEKDLYETGLLRHENILGYVVSDIGGTGAETQMLLVTEYHMASLYDHLRLSETPLSLPVLYKMARSIASGLSFLHGEIVGNTTSKPIIAHRDLKTKNILLKHDGMTCVIADLGLAVRKDRCDDLIASTDKRQGTRRYMAPEILARTIRKYDFQSHLQADMYSFGLVLWEIARCSDISGVGSNYKLPYQMDVGDDPDFDSMEYVVCHMKIRPPVDPGWRNNPAMDVLRQLMEECWKEAPSARLAALNVKKKLARNDPSVTRA